MFPGDKNKTPLTFFRCLLEAYIAYLDLLDPPNLYEVKKESLTILHATYSLDDFKENLFNSICAFDNLLTYNGHFIGNEDVILLLTLLHQYSPSFSQDPKFRDHYNGHPRLREIVAKLEGSAAQVDSPRLTC